MATSLPAVQDTQGQSLGREDPLEEGMATLSSILAWRIPWTEELGGLHSMGSQSDTTERPSPACHGVSWRSAHLHTGGCESRPAGACALSDGSVQASDWCCHPCLCLP